MLCLVAGRPLQNCTGTVLNVPRIEAPVATNTEATSVVCGSPYSDEDHKDKSSNLATGYLDDLFEDLEVSLIDSETLADKLNRVLENHSPCVSIGSGVDFSLGRDEEGRLVHQDHSLSVSLSSGLGWPRVSVT